MLTSTQESPSFPASDHFVRWLWVGVLSVVFACGCSAPGPTPPEYADRHLAGATLEPAVQERLHRDTAVALGAIRAGEFEEAADRAERVLRVDPRAGLAHAVLGRALAARAGRSDPPDLPLMERAEGEILLARKIDPNHGDILWLHAGFLEVDGQVTLAATVLDELLDSHPRHLGGLRAASRIRFELGQERASRPLLIRLLQVTPKDAAAVFRLAHCRVRLAEAVARGDTDMPIKDPANAARRDFRVAAQTFRDYQALAPRDVDGFLGEAHAGFAAAQLLPVASAVQAETEIEQVLAILTRAQEVDATAPGPAHTRGVILEHLGRSADARAAYESAIAKDAKFLPSILNMAHLLDANGDKKTARVYCQRALELSVSNGERRRLQKYLAAAAGAKK
jgi:Flp pilus assembly protein TadD